jgi:hypothetical protein
MLHRLQNRIPLIISILGALYIVSPILYYVYYAILSGKPLDDIGGVLRFAGDAYFVQFVLVMLITPIVGVGLVLKRKWGLVGFFVYGLALITQSVVNYILHPAMFSAPMVAGNIVIICILLLFIRLELRAPFYRPDWQIRGRRFKCTLPIAWKKEPDGDLSRTNTVDISPAGCFIASEALPSLGQDVSVSLKDSSGEFSIKGRVSWHSSGSRRFPKGFGVMFTPLDEVTDKRLLGVIVRR